MSLNEKYPYLTAWFVFFVFSTVPTILISKISQFFENPAFYLILEMALWIFVNFFIYKFVVNKLLIEKFPSTDASEIFVASGANDE